MATQRGKDEQIVQAARALLHDAAIVLFDVQRRSPPMFAARLGMLVTELEEVAHELGGWDQIAARYADTTTNTPADR